MWRSTSRLVVFGMGYMGHEEVEDASSVPLPEVPTVAYLDEETDVFVRRG